MSGEAPEGPGPTLFLEGKRGQARPTNSEEAKERGRGSEERRWERRRGQRKPLDEHLSLV